MTPFDPAEALSRIAEIDKMFVSAQGWGSWMAEASNERKGLVHKLADVGIIVAHNYELRLI